MVKIVCLTKFEDMHIISIILPSLGFVLQCQVFPQCFNSGPAIFWALSCSSFRQAFHKAKHSMQAKMQMQMYCLGPMMKESNQLTSQLTAGETPECFNSGPACVGELHQYKNTSQPTYPNIVLIVINKFLRSIHVITSMHIGDDDAPMIVLG